MVEETGVDLLRYRPRRGGRGTDANREIEDGDAGAIVRRRDQHQYTPCGCRCLGLMTRRDSDFAGILLAVVTSSIAPHYSTRHSVRSCIMAGSYFFVKAFGRYTL